jgi:DNA-binding HxlR family transcriptional regulator
MHLLVTMKMTDCSQNCGGRYSYGLAATLSIISGKWKPLILYFLLDGPKRYGELKRNVHGVSAKVLIQQLKELEANHVLVRTDYKEVPPRVDYALTPLGRSLAAVWPQSGRQDCPVVHLGNREHGRNGEHSRQARHFALAGC